MSTICEATTGTSTSTTTPAEHGGVRPDPFMFFLIDTWRAADTRTPQQQHQHEHGGDFTTEQQHQKDTDPR